MKISVFENMMLDEYLRFERGLEVQCEEIKMLPKGKILYDNKKLPYLQYKEGTEIKRIPLKEEDANEIERKLERRKTLKESIKVLKKNMKDVEKALGMEVINAYKDYRSSVQG